MEIKLLKLSECFNNKIGYCGFFHINYVQKDIIKNYLILCVHWGRPEFLSLTVALILCGILNTEPQSPNSSLHPKKFLVFNLNSFLLIDI